MNTFWSGLIIGVLVVIISLLVEYRTGWFSKRHKKELTVSIVSQTVLISPNDEEVSEKLEIKYDGRPVQSLLSLVFSVTNTGNVPISSSDYEEPIRIQFGELILDYSVSNPLSTGPVPILTKLPPDPSPNVPILSLRIEPLLINEGESFRISVLLPKFEEGNLKIHGRLVGTKILVEDLEARLKSNKLGTDAFTIYTVIGFILLATLMLWAFVSFLINTGAIVFVE